MWRRRVDEGTSKRGFRATHHALTSKFSNLQTRLACSIISNEMNFSGSFASGTLDTAEARAAPEFTALSARGDGCVQASRLHYITHTHPSREKESCMTIRTLRSRRPWSHHAGSERGTQSS
jgi:hypothetical protein